jgi:glycine oxidase
MSAAPDVLVVGGGVVGSAVAWWLAREGVSVTLLERGELAAGASGAAAGMLAPIGEDAGRGGPLLHAGLRALAGMDALCEELRERSGIDPEWRRSGILRVARDDAEAARLQAQASARPELGLELGWLDGAALRAEEPLVALGVRGALLSPREGHVRSPLLARAFARAAASLGARVETGVAVRALVRDAGGVVRGARTAAGDLPAGLVVLCAGVWTGALAGAAGAGEASDRALPIEPVRGQILSLDAPLPTLRSIVWGGSTYLVPKGDGTIVVGATEERVGFDCRVTAAGLRGLLDAAPRLVPALAGCTFRGAWAGLRPSAPDHLPLVGAWPGTIGLFVAAGHHRNGVLLASVTGEIVAGLVLGKDVPPCARDFAPARFGPTGSAA